MSLMRNLGRRKLRTTLTVLGIVIGIWALVVFSALANKINTLVSSGTDYYVGKVVVSDGSSNGLGIGIVPIDLALAGQIQSLDGVGAVDPQVQMYFEDVKASGFGIPKLIIGAVAGADQGLSGFQVHAAQGRLLTAADEGSHVTVLGSDMAREFGLAPGGTMQLRGVSFDIVGVLEPTLTAPDATAMVPLSAAQELFLAMLPPKVGAALRADELASQIVVYPSEGTDAGPLAVRIKALGNLTTITSADWAEQVGSTTTIFNAIIFGVGLISLIVGGLSVINTMAMSVTERTREIGIKRAIGSSRRRIIRELVSEAAVIGVLGGLIGLSLGAIVVVVANEAGRSSGTSLFDLTAGTAVFAVAFSTILGMVAGIIPAWNAARLDPVAALRYE
jgi:putative ABC transport system permease protein